MKNLKVEERLIVALDVDSVTVARDLVDELTNVNFFKIGWRLLMAGLRTKDLGEFWASLARNQKEIFIDLKLPDIGNTLANVVGDLRDDPHVRFLTLHEETQVSEIQLACNARGDSENPKLLTVPFRSSLDESDYPQVAAAAAEHGVTMSQWILARAKVALDAGCDGIIASGDAISLCRQEWPKGDDVVIVSPGIRPIGSSADDHKRSTTPTRAIELGADFLVVGRPILNAKNRVKAADDIIAEMGLAFALLRVENASPPVESDASSVAQLNQDDVFCLTG